ncbi:metal-dependent hydrolase, partial [Pelagicoccus sp. SDUM812002]|uniref:metal-dependent hydrolase n=1 Tax=Pelagicoccus sp. SDUM812002 TaxID=3041266 RepID=UPI00280E9892
MPDIDRRTSAIGRMTLFVSETIERRFGHRTATHSLLGMAFFAVLAMPLALVQDSAFWYFVFGYATHIFLDTWNKEGVPLLWPNRLEFVIYYNRRLRVAYGSSGEFTVLAVISLLALALVPVSMKGFESWFHRLLATPNAAIQDYLLWRDDYEVLAELSGENLLLRKSEKSELRIIDALDM